MLAHYEINVTYIYITQCTACVYTYIYVATLWIWIDMRLPRGFVDQLELLNWLCKSRWDLTMKGRRGSTHHPQSLKAWLVLWSLSCLALAPSLHEGSRWHAIAVRVRSFGQWNRRGPHGQSLRWEQNTKSYKVYWQELFWCGHLPGKSVKYHRCTLFF